MVNRAPRLQEASASGPTQNELILRKFFPMARLKHSKICLEMAESVAEAMRPYSKAVDECLAPGVSSMESGFII